jgi:hypothetical protein
MTCREFHRLWNEFFDAGATLGAGASAECARGPKSGLRATGPEPPMSGTDSQTDAERALLGHAARCAGCRSAAAGYQALRQALRSRRPMPAAPIDLADRILAGIQAPQTSRAAVYAARQRSRAWSLLAAIAASCAAAAAALLFFRQSIDRTRPNGPATVLHAVPAYHAQAKSPDSGSDSVDSRPLRAAMAEATEATWDLARSATEPAARISRQVLDAATGTEVNETRGASDADTVTVSVAVPSWNSIAPDSAALLQQVGDHVATGVRPLSNTARHAFGFLLGPPPTKPDARANPPAAKGA